MDTTTENKKKRFWLFLPLLILPFLALGFYALKSRDQGQGTADVNARGINTVLPGAKLAKDGADDKMSLYDQAKKDSAASRSRSAAGAFAALGWDTAKFSKAAVKPDNPAAANEARIKEKLAQINRQITEPPPVVKPPVDYTASSKSADLERLEKLLQAKQQAAYARPGNAAAEYDAG
jgi:hypothetical protein